MILLMGILSEPPLRLLAEACTSKGIPFVLFNQRLQSQWKIVADQWNPGNTVLSNGHHARLFRLDDYAGFYLRSMDHTKVPEFAECDCQEEINSMYSALFSILDGETTCRVVNPPSVQLSNNSKPFQSLVIKQQGFDIPDTCITSNEDEATAFIAKYHSVIYKSISGTRSIVKKVSTDDIKNLYKVKYCPVQFQEYVEGVNVRVHVIGQKVIATKICSEAVDYRYAQKEGKTTELKPFALSVDLTEKCINLCRALSLPFAGIDLLFTNDGRVVCFEVNPSPGYSYYEQTTGQLISHALADYLAGS